MSLRRHVLQVVALVTAVALVFGAFAGSASAKKMTKAQKAKVRAELRKQVKKNPGAVKRQSFLSRQRLSTSSCRSPFVCATRARRRTARTRRRPRRHPVGVVCSTAELRARRARRSTSARSRRPTSTSVRRSVRVTVAIGGALAAVVEFQDTYDGGALGNVNIKILPGNKTLTTSSVPLLWNTDITDAGTRSDANFAQVGRASGSGATRAACSAFADAADQQGCDDWTTTVGAATPPATRRSSSALGRDVQRRCSTTLPGQPSASAPVPALPGYTVYTAGGSPNGVLPAGQVPGRRQPGQHPGRRRRRRQRLDRYEPEPVPDRLGSDDRGGTPDRLDYNAADTVLRTNALSLGIAPGGVSVNMSTGTATTPGGLTTAQGSQDVTLGYSGGQANLFGNIPGKNVGIDVTVNLATKINSIVRIMDQDVFKHPSLIEGEDVPGRHLQLPPDRHGRSAELHPGRPSDGLPADRSGDHQGRQGPHREGHGAVRRQQPRPRCALRLPVPGEAVQRVHGG